MRVYRIATARNSRVGPYGNQLTRHLDKYNDRNGTEYWYYDFEFQRNSAPEHRPCPWSDCMGEIDEDEYFGFASLDQLRSWFDSPEDRHLLATVGYVCWEFEVDEGEVHNGLHQICFPLAEAKVVAQLDLKEV